MARMDRYKDPIREKKSLDKYNKWRKRVNNRLPELAARVFALRKVHYMGCGFHWSLEKRLGSYLHSINDYDNYPGRGEREVNRILFPMFVKDIIKAERSAKEKTNA